LQVVVPSASAVWKSPTLEVWTVIDYPVFTEFFSLPASPDIFTARFGGPFAPLTGIVRRAAFQGASPRCWRVGRSLAVRRWGFNRTWCCCTWVFLV